ncbi:MAG: nucleotidyltransferase family protein [Roseburia sp.]|nr:nucleotidyltransferase family protein [Anaeroplasma bactoclasticum]MCM1196964.1 nucleotidyltransferase family protein [Roseburia sp.]MCM1556691.1 nucleotidyltransferase family protein [Anaeroplasma bactoclasticum]
MKIVGTIVEYNPLHNGHIYALNEIKKHSHADLVVAVLSGNFTMRGDLSIFDKFEKTRQALQIGMDLVIELPFVCAVQNADRFAENAVKLLNLAKVSELWIGSESNNPKLYEQCYQSWIDPTSQEKIKELLALGKSYKEATSAIIHLPSNDLLGFSYYKAIKEANYPISLHTIKRIGSYDSLEAKEYASAYAIRSDLSLISKYCPNYLRTDLIRDSKFLFPYLKYKILSSSLNQLKDIFLVEEGLENRIKEIYSYSSLESFIDFLSTKRYTKSRIQRMMVYILFSINKHDVKDIQCNFLRILGYTNLGKSYLNKIKKDVNIFTNIKENLHPILDIELKITKILDMIYSSSTLKEEQGKPQEIENKD